MTVTCNARDECDHPDCIHARPHEPYTIGDGDCRDERPCQTWMRTPGVGEVGSESKCEANS